MAIKYIDTLEYVRRSEEIHNSSELAAYQIKQIETGIETAVRQMRQDTEFNRKDTASKQDVVQVEVALRADMTKMETALRADMTKIEATLRSDLMKTETALRIEIKDLRYEMLKFVVWSGIGTVTTTVSLLGGLFIYLH